MDLLGWFDSKDQTGGNLKELVFEGNDSNGNPTYSDDRKPHRYYRKKNGKISIRTYQNVILLI